MECPRGDRDSALPLMSVDACDMSACRAMRRTGQLAVRSGDDGGIGRRNARMGKVSWREKMVYARGVRVSEMKVRRRERFQNGRSVWCASGFQGGQCWRQVGVTKRGGTGLRNVRATGVRGARGRRGAGAEKVTKFGSRRRRSEGVGIGVDDRGGERFPFVCVRSC